MAGLQWAVVSFGRRGRHLRKDRSLNLRLDALHFEGSTPAESSLVRRLAQRKEGNQHISTKLDHGSDRPGLHFVRIARTVSRPWVDHAVSPLWSEY